MTMEFNRPQPINLSKEQLNQLREGFDLIDTDKNGRLGATELGKFLTNTNIQPQFAPLAIKLVDSDGDNQMSFDEFLKYIEMVNELRSDPMAIYVRLFNLMDKNKDGSLGANEVKEFLSFFSKSKISDKQIQDFIKRSDSNGDGKLSFKEIVSILGL